MKRMLRHFLAVFFAVASLKSHAQVVINELMQSNIDCIMDNLNEFPDSWVELYNGGASAVNLNHYKLGIAPEASEAWQLPAQTMRPKHYAVVYCDKEKIGMHTDFRLETGKGCKVYLFEDGSLIDSIIVERKQPAPNTAYGRETDGSETMGYLTRPTPGSVNCGQTAKDVLGDPLFSEPGGVFTSSRTITLTLTLPDSVPEGTVIRYTTNYTEPNTFSTVYTGPITINENTVIRAKLFRDGYLSPRSTVHSYLFFPTSRALTLPVISIVTNPTYLNNSEIGIYTDGSYQEGKKNYEFNWRRPINFEFFEKGNQPSSLNQLCETRIMGGATRGNKLKSLALYAHKRFGTKRFDYEFFPDQRPGQHDYKSIQLRNAGNDFDYLYMRDAIAQRTMGSHVDLDWQAWRPAIIYINGKYQGILNIRERSNEDHVYTRYDGLEDIDMIENWWDLKEGDWTNYNAFKAFYSEHGHTLAEYEEWMDTEEFINLMVMNLYFNNVDFPGNNIMMWRPRSEGGRWRWIAKDVDYIMGLYDQCWSNYRIIEWLYNPDYDQQFHWGANSSDATRLFRRLMDDKDFRREFIDHAAVYMGDFLNEDGIWAVWEPMYETIKTEYPYHRDLINRWWPNYDIELEKARIWLRERTDLFYQQLADYYKLGMPTPLTINKDLDDLDLELVRVRINGVPLSQGTFDGKFFEGREITIEGEADEGYEVSGWTITCVTSDKQSTTQHVSGPEYRFIMPSCKSFALNASLTEANGISDMAERTWNWRIASEQLEVYDIPVGETVSVYGMNGTLIFQKSDAPTELRIGLARRGVYVLKVGKKSVKVRL